MQTLHGNQSKEVITFTERSKWFHVGVHNTVEENVTVRPQECAAHRTQERDPITILRPPWAQVIIPLTELQHYLADRTTKHGTQQGNSSCTEIGMSEAMNMLFPA